MRTELARRFRALLSGSQTGIPDWTPLVAAGNDGGMFGPDDAPWIVHADLATLVGGIRALLVQAMHPGSLAGVVQHSRYEEDVLGRLNGTIRWLTICTFGSSEAIAAESERVNAMHARVRGSYNDNSGERVHYGASHPHLLAWVHLAFTDSFLTTHQLFGQKLVDGDAYVAGWANAVRPLGLLDAPTSVAAMRDVISAFDAELRVDDTTRRVVAFIKRVPFPRGAKPAYWLLFQAAVASLPESYRRQLGLSTLPRPLVLFATRRVLRVMRWILGDRSPMEDAALSRRALHA